LFTPFAGSAPSRPTSRARLGLALSQRLCEGMGGAPCRLETERAGGAASFRVEAATGRKSRCGARGNWHVPASAAPPTAAATLLYVEDNLAT
jgi:hypothetical protein